MSQFSWQIDIEDSWEEPEHQPEPKRPLNPVWFLVVAGMVVTAVLGGWFAARRQVTRTESELRETIQSILDLEHDAVSRGDGDLYFALLADDAAWRAAQLQPENLTAVRAGLTVTRAQAREDFVWANVSWPEDGRTYQRIAFFQRRGNQLIHAPSDVAYWGASRRSQHHWGQLVYQQIDESWAAEIAAFISKQVAGVCAGECLAGKRPFTLVLADDYAETAVPDQIRIPSPRLLALDENGQPAPLFWRQLRRQIESYLTPATIRFAVPRVGDGQTLIDYEQAAALFMADHPGIIIELVNLEELPHDLGTLAAEFDGAAVPPTEAMLAAGLVRDLTDYINTDPDFDQADFYEQIWRGAIWQERTWFMPQAANMHLVFYDKKAYREANLPEPSLRWTWEEMGQDVAALIPAQPEAGDLAWGFLDVSLDSLFSYAYNWNNQCTEAATILCRNPLQAQNVAAALDWYNQMAAQPEQMPDLTSQLPELLGEVSMSYFVEYMDADRQSQFILSNLQTGQRKAAIWVDVPVNYEYQLLLANLGVVPFPGSDRFDGITPLWVQGSFISQKSERPLAVWQWLKFLSYQYPTPRLIPARPSVAAGMGYWTYLPRPLGDAMRTAFPFSRPVLIEEKGYIMWEQVTAVLANESTPLQAAQNRPIIRWFE